MWQETAWGLTLFLVIQEGFEPPTHGLEGRCSIQLGYWTMWICRNHYIIFLVKCKAAAENVTKVGGSSGLILFIHCFICYNKLNTPKIFFIFLHGDSK